jgi:hypothetical protein
MFLCLSRLTSILKKGGNIVVFIDCLSFNVGVKRFIVFFC